MGAVSVVYDDVLSRVRITKMAAISAKDPVSFEQTEGDVPPSTIPEWVASGGTAGVTGARAHTGAQAASLTPNGTSAQPSLSTFSTPSPTIDPGTTYEMTAWVNCQAAVTVTPAIFWIDSAGVVFQVSTGTAVNVPASAFNVWTQIKAQAVAPANAVKGGPRIRMEATPPATSILYVDDVTLAPRFPADVVVERSTNGVNWTLVRGGLISDITDPYQDVRVDDYEFVPEVENQYRFTIRDSANLAVIFRQILTVTPAMNSVWLKSATHPFLNRKVAIVDMGPLTRPARGALFAVSGRRLPVAVSGVRGSRQFELTVLTDNVNDRESLGLLLDTGSPLYVHVPPSCPIPIPTCYVVVGDVDDSRPARVTEIHTMSLPMTEVAPPGIGIVGATVSWTSIKNEFATWTDVIADNDTWGDVLNQIGSPTDVIVGIN